MTRSVCVAAVALLFSTGCFLDDGRVIPRVGEPAIEYPAATLAGDTVTLASLRGRVVLLNLWATWCVPCREETPYLESLYQEHAEDGLHIVGISLDTGDAADQVAAFVEEYGVTYTILHDPQMRGMELYQVPGLPATFLIDREGTLRWVRYGPILEGDADFARALEEILS
ncbi:MAG: TlpA disulfide reductase family protein [Gemmatimonadota bacterium]|jgi:peroxiredoxin